MLSESVDQKPIVAVSAGMNTGKKRSSLPPLCMMGPRPFAAQIAHPTRIAVITSTNGAANRSTRRTSSMPR